MKVNDDKWNYILEIDEDLLEGGVVLSEYSAELIRNADLSFVGEAYVACLVMCAVAIETWLRQEGYEKHKGEGLKSLIDNSNFDNQAKQELHELRLTRNKWVHVGDPWDDGWIINAYNEGHVELEAQCKKALRIMRKIAYSNPWI